MNDQELIALAQQLIQQPSITPDDHGCQDILQQHLERLGFHCEHHHSGDVRNLWAIYGDAEPVLVLAGHTDVVPPGPTEQWQFPPFSGTINEGQLHGRGSADMKSALAAMVAACERFLAKQQPMGSIAFLITSDEEGPAVNGTQHVIAQLQQKKQPMTWCIVGEASSEQQVGDAIKIGRRGSLHAEIIVRGQQGHIAYPDRCRNPIPLLARIIADITAVTWDQGHRPFPPTSCQVSNLHAGDGTENVVPGTAYAKINWRYSPACTEAGIKKIVHEVIDRHTNHHVSVNWRSAAQPFASASQKFLSHCNEAIRSVTGSEPQHNTAGGTSDGRFIAPAGCEVVEIGVRNATIHQIDEHIDCQDLSTLCAIYEACLQRLLGAAST